jgi:UDP-3-O-[3-hydroxymyristoyl] N-acetylglucosamine deacetylase
MARDEGWQTTIARSAAVRGTGVHTGAPASMFIHPAAADTGVCFVRSDLSLGGEEVIPARHRHTSTTELATVIGDPSVAAVSTIEHVMAALHGLGVDNAIVEIDGPEAPIMDGSAAPFVSALRDAGLQRLATARRYIEVVKPVRVENGAQFGELAPHDGFRLDVEIRFDHPAIGRQRVVYDLTPDVFEDEIAGARTFGFVKDVRKLWDAGFALGASLENTVVVGDAGVMNPEGLRFGDEFVRHKVLDAIGDLALVGAPLKGAFRSCLGGHRLNSQVVGALLSDPTAYRVVEARPVRAPARAYGRPTIQATALGLAR